MAMIRNRSFGIKPTCLLYKLKHLVRPVKWERINWLWSPLTQLSVSRVLIHLLTAIVWNDTEVMCPRTYMSVENSKLKTVEQACVHSHTHVRQFQKPTTHKQNYLIQYDLGIVIHVNSDYSGTHHWLPKTDFWTEIIITVNHFRKKGISRCQMDPICFSSCGIF